MSTDRPPWDYERDQPLAKTRVDTDTCPVCGWPKGHCNIGCTAREKQAPVSSNLVTAASRVCEYAAPARDAADYVMVHRQLMGELRDSLRNAPETLRMAAVMVRDTGVCRVEGFNRHEIYEQLIAAGGNPYSPVETPPALTSKTVTELRKAANAIYAAVEQPVAIELSRLFTQAAEELDFAERVIAEFRRRAQDETKAEFAGPTWQCPNCAWVDEFTVRHTHLPEEGNRYVTMITCLKCNLQCTDARSESQVKTSSPRREPGTETPGHQPGCYYGPSMPCVCGLVKP